MSILQFHVKQICWSAYEQRLPILLQDKNGPCPLIALVNTLMLTDDIEQRTVGMESTTIDETSAPTPKPKPVRNQGLFEKKPRSVSPPEKTNASVDVSQLRLLLSSKIGSTVESASVLDVLGDILFDFPALDTSTVNGFLENLPLLLTGLDVNPNLTTGGFQPDEFASRIFKAFGLIFVHGWCRDCSGDSKVDAVLNKYQTFEAIQEYLLTSSDDLDEKVHIEAWVREHATQLTQFGLDSIDKRMAPDSAAIFFRNNHFLTLYKAQNNDLYLLITDNAFMKRANYVWLSVNSVSGNDDLYFTGDFTPLLDGADSADCGHESVDENLRFAQKLQEKEDSAYAKALQRNYEKRAEKAKVVIEEEKKQKPELTSLGSLGEIMARKMKRKEKKSGTVSPEGEGTKAGKKELCVVM